MTIVPLDLMFSVIYRHPRAAVWAALTDRDALRVWFLDNDFEPRVGKRFSVTGPHIGTVACVVVALDPPRRMEWSWHMPDLPARSRVVFTLDEVEGGTRLTVRHVGAARAIHETDITRGWPKRLDYLERWLGQGTRSRPDAVEAMAEARGSHRDHL